MKLVMIGHGMVGHKFIEAILEKADDELEITILQKNLVSHMTAYI